MKITLAILLNMSLLVVLLPWLRQQWQATPLGAWRGAFGLALGLRVGVGVVRNWHPQADAAFMSSVGRLVTDKIWQHPSQTWDILTRAVTVFPKGHASYDFVFSNTSNTWILIKTLAVLNVASLETDWLNALYISLFAFVGCWLLARSLANAFPKTPAGAGVVAFLLWPSVWFWATGISKEAVLLGSGAWLTARVVDACFGPARRGWFVAAGLPGTVGLALLHLGMRYFFAAPLLGVLGGVAIVQALRRTGVVRRRGAQGLVLAAVLGGGMWLVPQLSKAFSMNKFTNQVMNVYAFDIAHSVGRPHFEYPNLRPTGASIAAHAPLAVANALTRPWLGESWKPLYVAAALENVALLALLALAGWAAVRGRSGRLPFSLVLGLIVFCLVLAFLIGLTTPNLGTLNRYRSGLLPYLLLLLFQNDYAAAAFRRLGLGSWSRP
ncbi:hypothetical protein [Hymenobacter antarcticus]|uniref:Glycosyltransferase RgtA/B/C/D-like domain-containing protein n=1 Tax=Hymenobacter antarcticus TaxID=486270 RepID=A0ABP7P8R6_9BACT